jgi:hypothetical protein
MADVPSEPLAIPRAANPRSSEGRVLSIRGLKEFVMARFPEEHPLRAVILAERDLLTPAELLAKMEVWSVLLNRRA